MHRLIFWLKVAKFSKYNIKLIGLSQGVHSYEYDLDQQFFKNIDGDEIRKGDVKATINMVVTSSTFDMAFDLKGVVQIPCNRCLDEMDQSIDAQNRLIVKLGEEYSEETDEIVIIPRDEGQINIAWFLYEYIVLNIPIKHYHEPGKCNRFMSTKLRKHQAVNNDEDMVEDDSEFSEDDDTNENIDPRWDGLKGLSFDEN